MKISCLTVTHNRPEFMPWLLWNFDKQSHRDKELVVVDSSETAVSFPGRDDIQVIHTPGANVPQKRNIALQQAGGEAVSWFDDDDWKHPDFLKLLINLKTAENKPVAGQRYAWFVDIGSLRANSFRQRYGVLFAGMLLDTELARSIPFAETELAGSDITWRDEILKNPYAETFEAYCFFLCHTKNLGNLATVHRFTEPLEAVTETIGHKAWGKTTGHLKALQKRMEG